MEERREEPTDRGAGVAAEEELEEEEVMAAIGNPPLARFPFCVKPRNAAPSSMKSFCPFQPTNDMDGVPEDGVVAPGE